MKTIAIDTTTKNIKKKTSECFRRNTYGKNIRKKSTLKGFGGNTYSKNSKYKKKFFFVFPIYKRARYKT